MDLSSAESRQNFAFNKASEDTERLLALLKIAKKVYATNPELYAGLGRKINQVMLSCDLFLHDSNKVPNLLGIIQSAIELKGYIDCHLEHLGQDEELRKVKRYARFFGSWLAFDDDFKHHYFEIFTPTLRMLMVRIAAGVA